MFDEAIGTNHKLSLNMWRQEYALFESSTLEQTSSMQYPASPARTSGLRISYDLDDNLVCAMFALTLFYESD